MVNCAAEKGMAKLKQRFSLNKQLSQNLPNPNPANPYAMAAGGHHPGNPRAGAQQQPPSASWGSHSSQANPQAAFGTPLNPSASEHDGAAMTAAMAASAADEAGRLSEHRSMEQQQQQEEEAMMELAIKVSVHLHVVSMCKLWDTHCFHSMALQHSM